MITHELKTWPEFFKLFWSGEKPFELCKDDRGFRAGDILRFREYVKREDRYTGREISVEITIVLAGFPGLLSGYAILGFAPIAHIERLKAENARMRKAALAVIDEFTGADDGEYPAVENLLTALAPAGGDS